MAKKSNTSPLILSHAPDWLRVLEEQISAHSAMFPDAQVYGLLDCAFAERSYSALQKQESILPSRSLFDLSDKPIRDLQEVSPTLIPLAAHTASTWQAVLRETDGWPMLSVIVTPESLDALALRLSAWCIVDADGQNFVFRFADTRRLPDIVATLTPQQHGELFGPAHVWQYRARTAQWTELPLPATAKAPADAVSLTEAQCARLIASSEADEIMDNLRTNAPELMRKHDLAQTHEIVARGLARADRYHIGDVDRASWCRLYLQQPTLERMPAVIPLLAALLSKERGYADVEVELGRYAKVF